jgi:hypothetical protein
MSEIADKLNERYTVKAALEGTEPWRPRPSALGGCLREIAWRLSGALAEPRTPESMRVLELGHQRGEALERIAKDCWPNAEVQVPLQIPWPGGFMAGTCDLWIPSLRTIVDFKTAGAFTMGLLLEGSERGADEGYALQLNAYRHGIFEARRLSNNIKPALSFGDIRTVLVYEAKDSDARKGITGGMLVEQEVPYSAELEERYQTRLAALHELMQAHEQELLNPLVVPGMPRDEKGREHWKCRMKNLKPLYCSIGTIQGQCS